MWVGEGNFHIVLFFFFCFFFSLIACVGFLQLLFKAGRTLHKFFQINIPSKIILKSPLSSKPFTHTGIILSFDLRNSQKPCKTHACIAPHLKLLSGSNLPALLGKDQIAHPPGSVCSHLPKGEEC